MTKYSTAFAGVALRHTPSHRASDLFSKSLELSFIIACLYCHLTDRCREGSSWHSENYREFGWRDVFSGSGTPAPCVGSGKESEAAGVVESRNRWNAFRCYADSFRV